MIRFRVKALAVTLLAVGLASCGGGGDNGTGPSGSISLSVAPGALALTQGEDGTITVTVTRAGGFTGSVALSAQNLPSGVTIAGTSIASGASSAELTVAAGASAAVGTATATIRASGTDVDAATATFSLTIDVSAENGFAPGIDVESVDVDQGASQTLTIDVNRASGFAGAVTFSASDVPNGLTVSFDPVVVTGASTEVTLEADAGLAPGEYEITIEAETPASAMPLAESGPAAQAGVVVKSFALTVVIVQAGGGGPGNVTLTFCTQSGLPLFLAVKSGTGPWTAVSPTGAGATRTYSFNVGAAGGGVAYVLQDGLDVSTTQYYGSAAFLSAFGAGLCVGNGEYKSLNGTVANVGPAEQATISHAGGSATINPAGGTGYNLTEVFDGINDPVLATRRSFTGAAFATNRVYLLRDQFFPPSGTIPVIDFLGANSFAPVAGTITLDNLLASAALVSSSLIVDGRVAGGLGSPLGVGTSPQNFVGIPEAQRQANDFHLVNVTVGPASAGVSEGRQALLIVGDATVPRAVTLGPVMSLLNAIVQGSASNVLMRLQFDRQAAYDRLFTLGATQQVGQTTRAVLAFVQASYLAGATIDFAFPDLSALVGWNPIWNMDNSAVITVSAGASGHSGGVDQPEPPTGDGAVQIGAVRAVQVNP